MAQALFVSRDDIVKFTAVNGNVDVDKFIQWVLNVFETTITTLATKSDFVADCHSFHVW